MIDEDEIERILDECIEFLENFPSSFTEWESNFLYDLSDIIYEAHLTDRQIETLKGIWNDRVCGNR